jgi:magnesium transporter
MESNSPPPVTPQSQTQAIASRVEEMPSAEAAAILANLPVEQSADVCEHLDPNTVGDILSQMDVQLAATVITDMEPPEASVVLSAMNPDDRVDILGHIASPLHDQLIAEMTAKDAADVLHLEQYPPDSAGGIMTTEVTALGEHLTVEQAIAELRRLNEEMEQMFYVYVVDARKHLIGVLSMRDLIFARPEMAISRIMRTNVVSVPAGMDQEKVARMMRETGYLAVPVVDDRHRLVGLITLDDAVEVIEEEATEDVQKMFGAGAEERLNSPWQYSFRKRVWWLEVNLATAFLAGSVVGYFQDTLSRLAILGVYMPIVAGMGGNASAQAMSVSIRGLAVGKVNRRMLWEVMYRELLVGLLTGIAIGLTTAIVAVMWQHSPMLGLVVGLALVINHILACTSGAAIPFIMKKLGYDPAQSATIFATTVTDVAGFFALFALASLFMRYLLN